MSQSDTLVRSARFPEVTSESANQPHPSRQLALTAQQFTDVRGIYPLTCDQERSDNLSQPTTNRERLTRQGLRQSVRPRMGAGQTGTVSAGAREIGRGRDGVNDRRHLPPSCSNRFTRTEQIRGYLALCPDDKREVAATGDRIGLAPRAKCPRGPERLDEAGTMCTSRRHPPPSCSYRFTRTEQSRGVSRFVSR